VSVAFADPAATGLGAHFAAAARDHPGAAGLALLNAGLDGLRVRLQLIDAAERALDLEYYIFRGDDSGRLLIAALARAADRGVRVRILVDDGDTVAGDEQLFGLVGRANVELRVFNPFRYRGHSLVLRAVEFVFDSGRLDYRMHNKLLVVDGALALLGGRNVGNEYFQVSPAAQLADDDIVVVGAAVPTLAATFDEFWNHRLAVPARALGYAARPTPAAPGVAPAAAAPTLAEPAPGGGPDFVSTLAGEEPLAGLLAGRRPLVWAVATVLHDRPDRKATGDGRRHGRLLAEVLIAAATDATRELIVITPYFIPAPDERRAVDALRARQVAVRVVTNSLESTTDLLAQAAYSRARPALLAEGVELHELRARPTLAPGTGQPARLSRFGNLGLHAKFIVIDRRLLFVGSLNFDGRSRFINTEIGLLIASPALAAEGAARFAALATPADTWTVTLVPGAPAAPTQLAWTGLVDGRARTTTREPARHAWRRAGLHLLMLVPFESEL
jgi:putative cardiolipin synthase